MDKLFDQQIPLALWFIIDDMYSGLTTRVKWKEELSNTYPVLQGVRQGGILSTHLYKIFIQDLLLELEENSLGYHLGNVYIGTPTCADDVQIPPSESTIILSGRTQSFVGHEESVTLKIVRQNPPRSE
jgi:hypothetical protein